MDLNRKAYGKLEMSGVGQAELFDGSVQDCLRVAASRIKTASVRNNRDGEFELIIRISSAAFKDGKGTGFEDDPVVNMTRKWLQDGLVEQISDEEAAKLFPPWHNDSDHQRFSYLQATQSNWLTSPEEYNQLWDVMASRWPDYIRNVKRRSL